MKKILSILSVLGLLILSAPMASAAEQVVTCTATGEVQVHFGLKTGSDGTIAFPNFEAGGTQVTSNEVQILKNSGTTSLNLSVLATSATNGAFTMLPCIMAPDNNACADTEFGARVTSGAVETLLGGSYISYGTLAPTAEKSISLWGFIPPRVLPAVGIWNFGVNFLAVM